MTTDSPSPDARLFLTKAWGFRPETYPTFGFSQEGARTSFLRQVKPIDWLVIAGTKGEPTQSDERGRLLGMCQVARSKVDAHELLREIGVPLQPYELDANEIYKWPWAMPIIRAVRFDPPPDTKRILGNYLPGQEWSAYAINVKDRLGKGAVERILSLPTKPCHIAEVPTLTRERAYEDAIALSQRGGPTGPPPTRQRSGSERQLGNGYAYAFRLEGGKVANAIKIGSSSDPQARLKTLNKEIHTVLTGCRWKPYLEQPFRTEEMAYRFEQLLLGRFEDRKVPGENEVIAVSSADLRKAWIDCLAAKEWAI